MKIISYLSKIPKIKIFHYFLVGERNGNHSSILAWKIPGTEKPGGLHPTEPHRVRHDSATQHPQDPYKETRPQGKSGSRDLYATLT